MIASTLAITGLVVTGPFAAASTGGRHFATISCGPKSETHYAAPGTGNHARYGVASVGSVTVLQKSGTTLSVTAVKHAAGWKDTVVTGHGVRVHVGFQKIGEPNDQHRFWARLNSSGTTLTVVIQNCT
jgi:hypothetical protein